MAGGSVSGSVYFFRRSLPRRCLAVGSQCPIKDQATSFTFPRATAHGNNKNNTTGLSVAVVSADFNLADSLLRSGRPTV